LRIGRWLILPSTLVQERRRVQPWTVWRLVAPVAFDAGEDRFGFAGDLSERPFGGWLADPVRPSSPKPSERRALARFAFGAKRRNPSDH